MKFQLREMTRIERRKEVPSPNFSTKLWRFALILFGVGLAAASALAQAFVNGDFAYPLVPSASYQNQPVGFGWATLFKVGIANGSGSWGTGGHSGPQYAYLESDGLDFPDRQASMTQTVSGFSLGQRYRVRFWMARRNGNQGAKVANPLVITLNGSKVIFGPTAPSSGKWKLFSSEVFTTTQTVNTFTFRLTQTKVDSADLLDDLSIEPLSKQ